MLDRPCLILGPWCDDAEPADSALIRTVTAPDSPELLGIVRASRGEPRLWRRLWSSTAGLEVCETVDRALVMSVHPSRISRGVWIVRECDNNEVGRLHGDVLLDPWNQPFARRQLNEDGKWTLRELDGRLYADCESTSDGNDVISFANPGLTNPFLRMLVTGSFLLLRPRPK